MEENKDAVLPIQEKPEVVETQKEQARQLQSVEVYAEENGLIIGQTFDQRMRVCRVLSASGMLPKGYNEPAKVWAGLQYALELGFKDAPLTALRNITVINGLPSLWGDLPLAMVRKTGQLDYIKEYFINEKYEEISFENKNLDQKVFSAVCEIKRSGEETKRFPWTVKDTAQAGLDKKDVWVQYPKIMMKRKARAIALKDVFTEIFSAIDIAEHSQNTAPDIEPTSETSRTGKRDADGLMEMIGMET